MSEKISAPVLPHQNIAEDNAALSAENGNKSPSFENDNNDDNGSNKDTITEDGKSDIIVERKSKGVVEMEALAEKINTKYLILLYGGFAVLAYVLSLSK
jgi:SIT family siderophore-iron:H+ symporter-like MFS transporter